MLVTFTPIFVTDTKMIICYNFVAPLNKYGIQQDGGIGACQKMRKKK